VPGWRPRFPAAANDADDTDVDDTVPGTVFETDMHGRITTWVVVERAGNSRIRYARVVPGDTAGTVTVELAGDQHSEVTVTYELTALTASAEEPLRGFAAHYPEMMRQWADAIAASLKR
jgi:hypothetical protein